MLASLGLGGGNASRLLGMPKTELKAPVRRGIAASRGQKRRSKQEPAGPARRSSRIKGDAAANIYVTSDSNSRITIGGDSSAAFVSANAGSAAAPEPVVDRGPSRLPEETLTLESTGGTEQYGKEFMATLQSLSDAATAAGDPAAALSSDELGYAERMSQLTINETGVAKVVPEKIYSVAVHPSSTKLLVACGDKWGNLGLWNVDDTDPDTSGVLNWRPHTAVINWLQFSAGGSKLYSSSYDGTIRGMDIATGVFDFVAGADPDDEGWMQYGCVAPDDNTIYLADSEGILTCRDRRIKSEAGGSNVWRIQAHEKKINTISVNPVEQHILATASLDRTVRLWDARTLGGGGRGAGRRGGGGGMGVDPPVVPELAVLPEPATRSINSASFSPGGDQLLTVSQANQLRLYHNPQKEAASVATAAAMESEPGSGGSAAGGDADAEAAACTIAPTNSCYHDNKTGRWLAVFHAAWDPKSRHSFVVGSMSQPRQVEIYSTKSNHVRRLMSLQEPDYMASVQSRAAFHPTQDVVVCCNASGRAHVFRK